MRLLRRTLLALLLVGGLVGYHERDALAQFGANTLAFRSAPSGTAPAIIAQGIDTNIGITLVPKGTGLVSLGPSSVSTLTTTGAVSVGTTLTVGTPVSRNYFIRAVDHCRSDIPSAQLLATRLATNDWALARTATGAETYNVTCNIPFPTRTTASKGFRLDSFSLAHQITVVNLTSATFQQLGQVVYANNLANAITVYGGAPTITLPTATQANPYLTAGTLATPAFANTADASIVLDYQVVMANTGVYRFYGIVANFSEALY